MTIPLKKLLASTEASLHLVDGQFLFVWREKGESRYKFVSAAAVRSAVAREPLDSGWITPAVRRCGSGPRGNWALCWVPPQMTRLTVLDPKQRAREITVPLPGLVFAGIGKEYFVFATKGRAFSADDALYLPPLPNVNADGEICFGTNRVPPASAESIETAFAIFRDSAFNGHLANGKSLDYVADIRQQLFALAKAGTRRYPVRGLTSADLSVARLVQALNGRNRR